jgi:predicted nucleotidyltransferase
LAQKGPYAFQQVKEVYTILIKAFKTIVRVLSMNIKKVNQDLIKEIVERLVQVSHPKKIILFGSCARNEMTEGSDIDLLVIEEHLENKGKEMVCLRNIIGNIGVGVDILVYSQKEMKEWGHLPGTALYAGLKEGKTIYEASH